MLHWKQIKHAAAITVPDIMKANEKFERRWLNAFAEDMSEAQRKERYIGGTDGFLWHALSFGSGRCLEGDKARAAYDKADKEGAMEYSYYPRLRRNTSDDGPIPLNAAHKKAAQIDAEGLSEFYVIGKDYSWCYIRTHEGDWCGPYFVRTPDPPC